MTHIPPPSAIAHMARTTGASLASALALAVFAAAAHAARTRGHPGWDTLERQAGETVYGAASWAAAEAAASFGLDLDDGATYDDLPADAAARVLDAAARAADAFAKEPGTGVPDPAASPAAAAERCLQQGGTPTQLLEAIARALAARDGDPARYDHHLEDVRDAAAFVFADLAHAHEQAAGASPYGPDAAFDDITPQDLPVFAHQVLALCGGADPDAPAPAPAVIAGRLLDAGSGH